MVEAQKIALFLPTTIASLIRPNFKKKIKLTFILDMPNSFLGQGQKYEQSHESNFFLWLASCSTTYIYQFSMTLYSILVLSKEYHS